MKSTLSFIILTCFTLIAFSQKKEQRFGDRIFLPAIDIGYISHNSDLLTGGIIIKTSIEYRLKNNNNFFLRINYDTHDAKYNLENVNATTNIIKGKARFTDILLGPGYRLGDEKLRYFVIFQLGSRLYNYPEAIQNQNTISIEQSSSSVFTSRTTFGLEYYFNPKAALSIDLFRSQTWKSKDFWYKKKASFGFSLGIITSLF